jgi:hypothetical protein
MIFFNLSSKVKFNKLAVIPNITDGILIWPLTFRECCYPRSTTCFVSSDNITQMTCSGNQVYDEPTSHFIIVLILMKICFRRYNFIERDEMEQFLLCK